MSPDLSLDADERLLHEAVRRFCAAHVDEARIKAGAGRFDRELFVAFAEQGFFALGTPEGEGGARAIVAVVEPLGHALFPGPLVDTFLAVQLFDGALREALIAGQRIAASGVPPLLPFACEADLHLGIDGERVSLLAHVGELERIDTLGGEPFGRGVFEVECELPHAARGLFFADVALASYLSSAAFGLLERTAAHVATRKQFGRPLASFQAVAHPLADCHIALVAARALSRAAASAFDADESWRARALISAALRSSHSAALETAYVCHQKLGAIGITLEGPAHHVTRRIRQLATRAASRTSEAGPLLAYFGG